MGFFWECCELKVWKVKVENIKLKVRQSWNMKHGTWNSEHGTRNLEPRTLKLETLLNPYFNFPKTERGKAIPKNSPRANI